MRRFLRWVIGLPIVIFVAVFAIANRRWVTLSFDPFTQEAPRVAMDMPLWLLFFLGIFTGVIVGWIGSWAAQGKHRRAAREARSELGKLQMELAEARRPREDTLRQDVVPFNGGLL